MFYIGSSTDIHVVQLMIKSLPRPQIDPPPAEGLPTPTLVPPSRPFLDIAKFQFAIAFCHVNFSLLIENLVQDFNLVGAVMSRVTLIIY